MVKEGPGTPENESPEKSGNGTVAKHPGGRPSLYKPDVHPKEVFALACEGLTEPQMAERLGVSFNCLRGWKKAHPEFLAALKLGKDAVDSKVEASLFNRAMGYSHPDVHISNWKGEITVTPITKHYPPDTTACIFWLKNRKPKEWRDKVELGGGLENTNKSLSVVVQVFETSPSTVRALKQATDAAALTAGLGERPRLTEEVAGE